MRIPKLRAAVVVIATTHRYRARPTAVYMGAEMQLTFSLEPDEAAGSSQIFKSGSPASGSNVCTGAPSSSAGID